MALILKSQNVTNMYTPIELVSTGVAAYGGGGGGGVTDHGYLHGLGDNDHPQYMRTATSSLLSTLYQLTAYNSLSLGTAATQSFFYTSNSSNLIALSNSTIYAVSSHTHTGMGGALSDHSHGAVSTQSISGSNITLASASNGFTMAVPKYLTTAVAGLSIVEAGNGNSTASGWQGIIGSDWDLRFSNKNGVTFGWESFDGSTAYLTASIPAIAGAQTGISAIAGSAASSVTDGTIQFANSNGISFGLSSNTMTASYNATVFSNANNIEFGLAGSTVTALALFNQSTQTQNLFNLTLSGNTSGTMTQISSGTLTLYGGSNVTLSQSGNRITINASAGVSNSHNLTLGGNSTSAGAGYIQVSSGTLTLAGGNNITLSQNGNAVTIVGNAGSAVAHNVTVAGNATSAGAGYVQISTGTLTIAGGNNITLSQDGNAITISGAAQGGVQTGISGIIASDATYISGSVRLSAQANITIGSFLTSDSQYVRFSVGNYITTGATPDHTHGSNISFGNTTNATESVVRASSSSNGLTMVIPTFLTTAMQSVSSSVFAKTGFTSQSTAGTDIVGTLNTIGLNVGVPKWITTGAQVSHTHGSLSLSLTNLSGTYSSASNGLTLSLTGYPATSFVNASESGNIYFVNSLGSNITWGSSTAASATSIFATAGGGTGGGGGAGTGFTTSATNGSVVVGSLLSNGLKLWIPPYLTTATGGGGAGAVTFSAGTSSAALSSLVFSNSNGLSFGLNNSTLTGIYTVPAGTLSFQDGGGISWASTPGSVSNITIVTGSVSPVGGGAGSGTTIGATNGTLVKFTLNSAGLNMSIPAYLTTAGAQALTFSAGANSAALSSLVFSNDNSVTFGLVGSTITANFGQSTHTHNLTQYVGLLTTNVTGASATISSNQFQLYIPQGSLYYQDGNGVSFSGFSSGLSTTISAYVGSIGAGNFTAGISTHGNTGGTTGLVTNQLLLVGGSNITLSQSSGSGGATVSIYGGAGGGGAATDHTHGGTSLVSSATSNSTETIMRFVSSSNGLTFIQPSFLTTAANSTHNHNTQYAGILATGITGGTATINSSEVKINFSANVGSMYFSDIAGFSWSMSTNGSSTTVYLITA